MPIIWLAEQGEEIIQAVGEAQSAIYRPFEIAAGLVAAGWAVVGGIGYWSNPQPPVAPGSLAGLAFWWYNQGGDDKQKDF